MVTVERVKLLDTLKENRAKHRDLFLKAQEGYRARVIEELDEMLKDARDGKHIRVFVELEAPVDHTDDYDRVISMLEWSTDDRIVVDERMFRAYVLDQWGWSEHALFSNSTYAGGGKISKK